MSKKNSHSSLFIELAKPDEKGVSREVSVAEFAGKYSCLILGNGGSWCRDDTGLGKKYKVCRRKEKNKIVGIKLDGFQDNPINRHIPPYVREALSGKKCVVLYTSKVEIDHKIGRREHPNFSDISRLEVSDFQPLSKAANDAKRQYCKECRNTSKRFDAKKIGYHVSQIEGDENYKDTCVGCYWYDPYAFNQSVSKNFEKKK